MFHLAFYRHLLKRKWYHFLQIASLALGLTAIGFTVLYVEHELTYDNWHPGKENIYRISYENNSGWFASLAKAYSNKVYNGGIPEIESVVRFRRWPAQYLHVQDEKFYEQKILFTDPGSRFFEFFDFPFAQGDPSKALSTSHSAVISASLAEKLFKGRTALGETFHLDTMALTIAGVFQDLPSNTHLDFNVLITNQSAMDKASGHFTYGKLNVHADPAEVEKEIMGMSVETTSFFAPKAVRLIGLLELHFDGNLTYELKPAGNRTYLWILVSIGVIIMVIAVTNFINLSVALFTHRSKEIAVRKSIGASAQKLSQQFLGESAIFVLASFLLCLLAIYLLAPSFSTEMELHLLKPFDSDFFILVMMSLSALIVILTAIYPTLILPRIRILDLFNNQRISSHHGIKLRSALIVVQFTILFFVCCSLWLVSDQLDFIENKDLGFKKESVIKIKRAWNVDSLQYSRLKTELLNNDEITAVSEGFAPGDEDYGFSFKAENSSAPQEGLLIHGTDFDYLKTLQIEPIEGIITDKNQETWPKKICVINETLAKKLGYEEPVGSTFMVRPGTDDEKRYTIMGVVKDYNFYSLHEQIPPIMVSLVERSKYVDENILVRVNTSNLAATLAFIKKKTDEIIPDHPVSIGFLDEDLGKMYAQEKRLSTAAQILVFVSVILSFTGLIALCSYMINFRMKEVAIRKVFGAQAWNVITLFLKAFMRVTIIGFILGASIAYFSVSAWMNDFAYRISIGFDVFILTFIIILIATILLTVLQTMKAVRTNPVKVLKEE